MQIYALSMLAINIHLLGGGFVYLSSFHHLFSVIIINGRNKYFFFENSVSNDGRWPLSYSNMSVKNSFISS